MKQGLKPIIMYGLMAVFIILPTLIFAGDLDPGCDPSCNCRVNPDDPDGPPIICPIDDGLYALLAIGIGYGIIKVRKQGKVAE